VGQPIEGLQSVSKETPVFHNGTAMRDGRIITAGGRVLTVVGQGATMVAAQSRAYEAASRIHFDGMHFRRDIGARLAGAVVPAGRE
jgi:phosphoribosylamine--glycine ligase